jgi:hypothetical protein
VGEAALGEQFQLLLELLLALQEHADVVLEQVELTLEVHPACQDHRREHHQLQQDREIDPAVQPPVPRIDLAHNSLRR